MSHNNSILNLLNLKDININFINDFYSEDVVNNVIAEFFHAILSYVPKDFPNTKIIINKFHIVQLFSRSLNKTRITIAVLNAK